MSDTGVVQRLTLPGLLSAFLLLGGTPGLSDMPTNELGQPSPTPARDTSAHKQYAQAVEAQSEPAASEAAFDDDGALEDVPFSELNEALTAARSRLAELTKAADIAKVAGELREQLKESETENRQLKSALSRLQTEHNGLQSTQQATESRLEGLEAASGEAAAEVKRLSEELASMRTQNGELEANLEQAQAVTRASAEEAVKVRADLGARVEALTAAANGSATEIGKLQRDLDAARGQIQTAERQRTASDVELAELKETSEEAISDSAKLAKDLDATITELVKARDQLATTEEASNEAKAELAAAEQEADVLREQLLSSRSESVQLREKLEVTETDLDKIRNLNAGLEQQVELLKTAAGKATDAARQNLLAVENRINEINAALASVKADELLQTADDPAATDEIEIAAVTEDGAPLITPGTGGWIPRPSPPRANIQNTSITTPVSNSGPPASDTTPISPLAADAGNQSSTTINLASLTTDLPANRRQGAQELLASLKAEEGSRGLSMTVPGAELFAVNSEEIEPSAFGALANVAELVNLYETRDVLIIGHTDAVGDANYNQELSERRAALIKQFFVDKFDISADRLLIEGQGEQNPITSNTTADGRNANRRVEVVILK